jgi:hypothetical protein
MHKLILVAMLYLFLFLGCGGSVVKNDAGPHDDANTIYDAGTPIYDADINPPVDANTIIDAQPAGANNRELTPAAGIVSGGGYKVDFQLGHWVSQKKTSGGATTTEGAAAIKP